MTVKQLPILTLAAVLTLSATTLLADETPIQAKLVKIITSASIDKKDRSLLRMYSSNIKSPLISFTFLAKGKNIIEVKKDSLVVKEAKGWKMGSFPRVGTDRESLAFSVEKAGDFLNKVDQTKVEGTIDVLTAKKLVLKSFSLLAYDEPLSINNYTFTLMEDRLKVEGDLKLIKEITVEYNDETIASRGSSSSNDTKTYMFKGIGKGAKISFSYWNGVVTEKVHFSK